MNLWVLYIRLHHDLPRGATVVEKEEYLPEYITFILFIYRTAHIHLLAYYLQFSAIGAPGLTNALARSYFIGNRGHDLNGGACGTGNGGEGEGRE